MEINFKRNNVAFLADKERVSELINRLLATGVALDVEVSDYTEPNVSKAPQRQHKDNDDGGSKILITVIISDSIKPLSFFYRYHSSQH